MRDEQNLTEEVRSTMADVFGLDEPDLPANPSQTSLAAWTSLKHMLLMVGLEEHFGVELSMEEMLAMKSQSDIVRILQSRATATAV
jgi:acyl carrier protein